MKAAPLEYRRPSDLTEALALMAQHGDEAKPLAGGQSLIPLLATRLARPALLVDLQALAELQMRGPGRLGAMVTNAAAEIAGAALVPPVAALALPHIGHFQTRTRGTVGGSLAHADPAAEWPALALLTDAELVAASAAGMRSVAARDFMQGPLTTVLRADELLLEVRFPQWAMDARCAFAEVARRPGDFALAGAAALAAPEGPRAVIFAVGALPQRVDPRRLDFQVTGDVHASAAYRRDVGRRLLERVLAEVAA